MNFTVDPVICPEDFITSALLAPNAIPSVPTCTPAFESVKLPFAPNCNLEFAASINAYVPEEPADKSVLPIAHPPIVPPAVAVIVPFSNHF
mgnify:CR=1 FL=1